MVQKVILIIMLPIIIMFASIQVHAYDTSFDIVYYEDEFLVGKETLNVFSNTEYHNIGAWSDGSFLVHIGERINFYNCDGSFSHSIGYTGHQGGRVFVKTDNDNMLELYMMRPALLVKITKEGNVVDFSYIKSGEKTNTLERFSENEQETFDFKEIKFDTEQGSLTFKLPPKVAFPMKNKTNITAIAEYQNSKQLVFDDRGVIFLNSFVLSCIIVLSVSIMLTLIVLFLRRSLKK